MSTSYLRSKLALAVLLAPIFVMTTPAFAAPALAHSTARTTTIANPTWSNASELPHSGVLNAGGRAWLTAVSCATSGNCTVVGAYSDSLNHRQALVNTQINGVWSNAIELPRSGLLNVGGNAVLNAVSCASPGNCTVAGYYEDANTHTQALVDTETNGTWAPAIELPNSGWLNAGGQAQISAVSCASAGSCSVVGRFLNAKGTPEALVATETNGVWSNAEEVPTMDRFWMNLTKTLNSISCSSPGNCTAVGNYVFATDQEFLVTNERNGTWDDAYLVDGSGALGSGGGASLTSVSCVSSGNCTAAGYHEDMNNDDQAIIATESNFVWSYLVVPGSAALNVGGGAALSAVSCATPGNCTVAGNYTDGNHRFQAMVATEENGTWSNATEVPGSDALNAGGRAALTSVTCNAPGNCTVAGYYADVNSSQQAMVATESSGVWSNAVELAGSGTLNVGGSAQVAGIACPVLGSCVAAGSFNDHNRNYQAMIAVEAGTLSPPPTPTITGIPQVGSTLQARPGAWPSGVALSYQWRRNGVAIANATNSSYTTVSADLNALLSVTVTGSLNGYHSVSVGSSAQSIAAGTWSNALELAGSATLNLDGNANLNDITCPTDGNCTAVGNYLDANGDFQAMVATETSGVWSNAIELLGGAALNVGNEANLLGVSCAAPGDCTVVGSYRDSHGDSQAMVATESSGVWLNAVELPGSSALNAGGNAILTAVSCTSSGDCTVAGSFSDADHHGQAMVATESNGVWANAEELQGSGALNTGGSSWINSISCPSVGNCTVAGYYEDNDHHLQAMVASEVNGGWLSAIELPRSDLLNQGGFAGISAVSCASAGNCTVAGHYQDVKSHPQAMVATENDGVWSNAIELPNSGALNAGGGAFLESVSCPTSSNCTVAGNYKDAQGHSQALVASDTNGVWSNAIEVPGSGALNVGGEAYLSAVSCSSTANCAVAGNYTDQKTYSQAMVATETNGVWSHAIAVPGSGDLNVGGGSYLNAISCSSIDNCTLAGIYTDAKTYSQAMISTEFSPQSGS